MSLLFSAHDDERTAFVKGFWRGLAAPALLYSRIEMPDFFAKISPVSIPRLSDAAALDQDACAVASDMNSAIRRYAKATSAAKAKRRRFSRSNRR